MNGNEDDTRYVQTSGKLKGILEDLKSGAAQLLAREFEYAMQRIKDDPAGFKVVMAAMDLPMEIFKATFMTVDERIKHDKLVADLTNDALKATLPYIRSLEEMVTRANCKQFRSVDLALSL